MQALIASPLEAPTRPCSNCKHPMLMEQEWCLECGAARARRSSDRAGLRSSAGVAALTLTTKRTLSPRVVIAQVTMPTQGVAAAPTVAPGTSAPLASVGVPTTLPATKLPKVPVTATPSIPAPLTIKPGRGPKTVAPGSSTTTGSNNTSPVGTQILLDTNAASTYNTSKLPPASFGDPAKAIDGDPSTSWTYTLDPARGGKVGAGLVIDLKSPQVVTALTVTTPSPGMAVEFYGAAAAPVPPAITDPRWKLKGRGHNFRYVVVWIPRAATGQSTGIVGVSEIAILR